MDHGGKTSMLAAEGGMGGLGPPSPPGACLKLWEAKVKFRDSGRRREEG